jgi:uncharacterized protein (TIGR00645 family)
VETFLERLIVASRWIQAPLYLGLVVASLLYSCKFAGELWHICHGFSHMKEEELMLGVLTLVDITMVANLIFMVIIGGYSIFVSKLDLQDHPDRPEWLDHTNASTLKIKLSASLIGVSGIHLLKSFINLEHVQNMETVKWQVIIHGVFLASSLSLAISERMLHAPTPARSH